MRKEVIDRVSEKTLQSPHSHQSCPVRLEDERYNILERTKRVSQAISAGSIQPADLVYTGKYEKLTCDEKRK